MPLISLLVNFSPMSGTVTLGDRSLQLPITGSGSTRLTQLGQALLVPKLSFGLISISVLDQLGCVTFIANKTLTIHLNGQIVLRGSLRNGLYHLDSQYSDILFGTTQATVAHESLPS